MPNDPILHLLGLARKAGKIELGEEPVGAACRARYAKLVLLASDAAANTRRRCAHFGEAGNVLWLEIPYTKEELGFQFGRGSCAMLALTDSGFAASIVEKLAARDPEHYGPAAEQLRIKADRVLQRQREKRQHEKNLREGKRKPWAPPAPEKKDESKPQREEKPAREEKRPQRQDKKPFRSEDKKSFRNGEKRPFRSGEKKPFRDGEKKPFRAEGKKPFRSEKNSPADRRKFANSKPKPPGYGGSANRAKDGSDRPVRSSQPGPGGRKLTGKFRKKS